MNRVFLSYLVAKKIYIFIKLANKQKAKAKFKIYLVRLIKKNHSNLTNILKLADRI